MENNIDFERLFGIARKKLQGIDRIALAVSGSPEDIALIKISAETLGKENVLAIVADTDTLSESAWTLIEKACDTAEITFCVVPFEGALYYEPNSYDYKLELFKELLHEAWLHGLNTLADGCTDENRHKNGNDAQVSLGILSPFTED